MNDGVSQIVKTLAAFGPKPAVKPAAKVGIALGSGSARGFAHIGILRALEEMGIEPMVVSGTSVGSIVGAAYAAGRLEEFEDWVRHINWWDVMRLMDPKINGLAEGERFMGALGTVIGDNDINIEVLPKPFGAVATDLSDGRAIWFQNGPLLPAVRASIALPGLFSPVLHEGCWLVDGGLVDPVPVALCRALGAEQVIAVNLNADLVGKRPKPGKALEAHQLPEKIPDSEDEKEKALGSFGEKLQKGWMNIFGKRDKKESAPGLFEVFAGTTNIMQDRITRSRLAGDPPDVVLSPRLGYMAVMDFDKAEEAIEKGYQYVQNHRPMIVDSLEVANMS